MQRINARWKFHNINYLIALLNITCFGGLLIGLMLSEQTAKIANSLKIELKMTDSIKTTRYDLACPKCGIAPTEIMFRDGMMSIHCPEHGGIAPISPSAWAGMKRAPK